MGKLFIHPAFFLSNMMFRNESNSLFVKKQKSYAGVARTSAFVILCFLLAVSGNAQTTVTTSSSTTNSSDFAAVGSGGNYGATSTVYLASELTSTWGYVTGLAWNYDFTNSSPSGATTLPIKVWLNSTAATTLTSGTTYSTYTTVPYTSVFNGTYSLSGSNGFKALTLTTPYLLNSATNLIVVGEQDGTSSGPDLFFYCATAVASTGYEWDGASAPVAGTAFSTKWYKPDLQVTFGKPVISTQPATTASICAGGSQNISIVSSITTTYEWQESANGTTGWADVVANTPAGASYSGTSTLAVSGISTGGTYFYRCIVKNGNGASSTTTSNNCALTVNANTVAPTTQATNITFSAITATGMTINWTNGNGAGRAVFMLKASTGNPVPVNGTSYAGNTVFTGGTQIGASGWYCIYSGTGSGPISVTGLLASTTYNIQVCEYNTGTCNTPAYNSATATNNPKTQATIASCTPPAAPTAVTPSGPTSICLGSSLNLNATAVAGNTINWYTAASGGSIVGTSNSAANFSVAPATTGSYYAEAVTTATGCLSTTRSATAVITVNPLPQGSLTGNSICTGAQGQLTWTASAGTGPFTVVYNDGTANRTASGVVSGTAFNPFSNPGSTANYTLVSVTDVNTCVRSATFTGGTGTITVGALPGAPTAVTPSSPINVCVGLTTNVNATSAGNTINWYNVSSGGSILGNVPSAANYTATPVFGPNIYYAEALTAAGCKSATRTGTATITGLSAPTLSVTPTTVGVCNGVGATLTASGATTYAWAPATGLNTTSGASVVTTATTITTYTVTGTVSSCTAAATVAVTPVPGTAIGNPTASASAATVCPSATVNLSTAATTETLLIGTGDGGFENATSTLAANGWTSVGATTPTWFVGTAGGAQAGTKAAFIGTSATTYSGSGSAIVNHFYRDIVIPAGATNVFLNYYLKYPTADATYDFFYVFTTTTASTPVANTLPTTGYTQRFVNTSSTYSAFTAMPQIDLSALAGTTVRLVFTFKNDGSNPIADPAVDNITLTCTPAASAFTYNWSSSPGGFTSTSQNPTSNAIASATTYTVTATNTATGCVVTASTAVSTFASPQGSFTGNTICPGGTGQLTWTASAGTGPFNIVYNSGSQSGAVSGTAFNSIPNPSSTTNFTLTSVTDAHSCVTSSGFTQGTATVTVNSTPSAPTSVTPSSASSVCAGSSINLNATSAGSTINWFTATSGGTAIGSSASGVNLAYVPVSTTSYYAESNNGCASATRTATALITLNPLPQGSLTGNSVCSGSQGQLTFTATAGTGPFTVVYFDGTANRTASGVTSGTAFNVFSNPVSTTNYTLVSVTDANTCVRSSGFTGGTGTINVGTLPGVPTSVLPSSTSTICAGSTINLNATSAGNTINWYTQSSAGSVVINTASGANSAIAPPVGITTYYAEALTSLGCKSTTRAATAATTVVAAPSQPGVTNNYTCGSGTVTLGATGAAGGEDYKWYSALSGGSLLQTGAASYTTPSISTTTTYYVTRYQISGAGCESTPRVAVTATVYSSAGAGIDAYTASRSTGITYTDISGTTAVTSWLNGSSSDNMSTSLPIGFNFSYDGGTQTVFRVSTDGFITFNTATRANGGNTPSCNNVEPYSYDNTVFTSTGKAGTLQAIAPFYNDLSPSNYSLNSSMHYTTTGSSPNRVLTVQWRGMSEPVSSSSCSGSCDYSNRNFQVKLYETSNNIEFWYSTMYGGFDISDYSYTVGINSSTLTSTPSTSQLFTQQSANSSTFGSTAQNGLTTDPTPNSKITLTHVTPTAATGVPLCISYIYPANGASNQCPNTSLSWDAVDGVPTAYDVYFGTTSSPSLVASNLTTTYYNPTLANNTTYFWKVVAKNAFGSETNAPVYSFTTSNGDNVTGFTASAGVVSGNTVTICNGVSTTITINGNLSSGSEFQWTSPFFFDLGCKINPPYPLIFGNCAAGARTFNSAGTFDVFARGCNTTSSCQRIIIKVNSTVNYGTVSNTGQSFCGQSGGTINPITFSTAPSGGAGTFNYQWYFFNGTTTAPTGTSVPVGWTLISGANTNTFTPGSGLTSNITYACMVDPTGSPDCGASTWAASQWVVTINALPTVTYTGLSASYCVNGSAATLTGSPVGGTFSGTGISGSTFTPSTAGVGGPYTITYSYSNGTCSNTATHNTTVNAQPTVSYSGLSASYCVNGSAATLTGFPSGGTFSGTGISGNTFTPATAGVGGPYNIVYSYTDVNLCSNTATHSTTVNAQPTVTYSGLSTSYCVNGSAATLTGSPSGGTFSGSGVSGSTFTPATAGVGGPYNIVYSYTDANSCSNTATHATTVNAQPTVTYSGLSASYCVNGSAATLTGSPSGGTFSGTGISGNTFIPATAGVGGPYSIVYSYTDANSCSNTATHSTTVNAQPTVTYSGLSATYCVNAGAATLTGSPSGGTFSGTGISGNTFTPATAGVGGPYNIVYSYTDGNACSNTATHSTTVNAQPTVTYSGLSASYCVNAGAATLTGSPSGGTFSGSGISGNTFTPSTAGVGGPYNVVYSYTDANSCSNTATHSTTVNAQPTVTYSGLSTSYCVNGSAATLSGSPSGGTFSGTGISGNTFTPATAGVGGPYSIVYSYTDANSCSNTATHSTTVNAQPTVTYSGLSATYCVNASAATLTGSPSGGTFSGTGISGNTFTPATAGVGGPYNIVYSYTDGNACSNTVSHSTTVNAQPTVSFSGLNASYCVDASAATLTGAPTGGTFSGSGISGNTFTPATAGAGGPYNITYSYTDANSCSNTSTQTATVTALPTTPVIASTGSLCSGGNGAVTVTTASTSAAGGIQYSLNGGTYQAGTVFTPISSGTVCSVVAQDANGCISATSNQVTVLAPTALSNPTVSKTDVRCFGLGNGKVTVIVAPHGGTPPYQYSLNGGTYQSSTSFVNLGPGTYTVTAQDANGCTVTSNTVTVAEPPVIASAAITGTDASCNGANNGSVTVSTLPTGGTPQYTYSLNGGGFSLNTTYTNLAPGNYTIVVQDAHGCTLTTNTVTVSQPTTVTAGATNTGSYAIGQTIQLNGSASGGTPGYSYSWTGPGGYTATGASASRTNATVVMSGPYNVIATDANGCTAGAVTNVVVNSSTTYTWTGANGTAWNIATNWTPLPPAGGPNACSDDVVIPHVANQPILSNPVSVGNIELDASALLTLNADLSVCKNVLGGIGGIFSSTTGTGSMILSGNTPQTINGFIQVNRLRLNNPTGATMVSGASLKIFTSLDLQTGNFNALSTGITFLSTSVTQVAIIDNFSPGYNGTLSGTIYAQRFYGGGTSVNSYNQHFMGSPVNNPAFSQFGASGTQGYIVPTANCDESHVAANSPYSSVLALDETHGAVCTSAQWFAETSNSGSTINGKGYAVAKTGAGTLTLNGTANLNPSYTINGLTNSNWINGTLQGHTVSSGWHLVANPYLATLDINSTNTGFDNQIQVWNSNGPFAGTYQPGMVGVDAVVAPFQGFMVHKTNPGGTANFSINASDRVRTAHTFFHANDNELKIVAENTTNHMLDQTVVAFNSAASDQFDPQYDANKPSGTLNRHTIYSVNNTTWMSRNILHDVAQTSTVPVGFEPGANATYNFNFTGINTFDATSYVYLEDKTLHIMHDVRSGDYSFTADSSDNWDRFVLHFTPPAVMSVTDATCTLPGTLNITQPGAANWNYTVTDNNNHVIGSGVLNQTSPLTLTAPSGSYTLTLTDVNNYTVTQILQVNGPDAIAAAFTASSNTVQESQNVVVTSTTPNATNYQWNLGNGQTANTQTVTYDYTAPGSYTVVLTVENLSGCTSTTSQTITVNALATGLSSIVDNKAIGIWSNEDKVYVDFRALQKVDAVISIYNVLGQQVSNEKFNTNMLYQKEINNVEAAYMIVSVKNDNQVITKKVFINNMK